MLVALITCLLCIPPTVVDDFYSLHNTWNTRGGLTPARQRSSTLEGPARVVLKTCGPRPEQEILVDRSGLSQVPVCRCAPRCHRRVLQVLGNNIALAQPVSDEKRHRPHHGWLLACFQPFYRSAAPLFYRWMANALPKASCKPYFFAGSLGPTSRC